MAKNRQHGHSQNRYSDRSSEDRRPSIDLSGVKLGSPLDPELFNGTAKRLTVAVGVQDDGKPRNENKPTQLRRFYDELVLWETRVSQQPGKFAEYLPFIRMMNAKVAYAEGRKLVNADFVVLMSHTLGQVKDPETLTHCKLFWEAFMGFYKSVRPKD
jgi:CRISPR-associated protein Csm2